MGVALGSLITGEPIELERLKGKKIAIDAFNTLFQFLTIIRDRTTGQPLMDSKGRVTSHLSGLFYRTANFIEAGLLPVYVFDGEPPAFKAAVIEERKTARDVAHVRWQFALAEGDLSEALKRAKMSARLTGEMIEQSKQLLTFMGVPWVQAPSEGEAQCAAMCSQKIVWASASQDWDSLLFGSPRMIRNLSVSGRRKIPRTGAYVEIKPELLELKDVLLKLGIDREQLIAIGMLVGTDFNPGIPGIGPKKALALVKKHKKFSKIMESVKDKWKGPEPQEVLDFFKNPPVDKDVKIESKPLQPDKIRQFMVDNFEFSLERVNKVIKTLSELKPSASGLGKFLK
ncbi:MAG: flap endonuclease-1 [Candidatus Aenigmarchaeota archaeon]|nr:flap endonuclease-1 [Candidatus Aenigmarchaeota archaeon]